MQSKRPRYERLTRFSVSIFGILGFLFLIRAIAPSLTHFLAPVALVCVCGFLLSSAKGHTGDLDS